jgi:hypothetical protein
MSLTMRFSIGICIIGVVAILGCAADARVLSRRQDSLESAIKNVDVLFVIDKSLSMLEEQAKLAEQMPKLVGALVTGDRNGDGIKELDPAESVHLGVVTSDVGLAAITNRADLPDINCNGQGDDGILQNTPHPTVEGVSGITPLACKDLYPRFLEITKDNANIDEISTDFQCIARVGAFGCGFEQPLEAALKALWPSNPTKKQIEAYNKFNGGKAEEITFLGSTQGHGDLENKGFLREDSLLAVVVVTDENDCSVGAQGNMDLLKAVKSTTLPAFLAEDPEKAAKVNMRCFYDEQLPEAERNKYPLERYLAGFKALRPDLDNRVIFAVIGGVPVDLVDQSSDLPEAILGNTKRDPAELVSYYSAILEDPRMIEQEDLSDPKGGYLAKACVTANPNYDATAPDDSVASDPNVTETEPARRFVELAQLFGVNGVVQSLCEESFVAPVETIILALTNRMKASQNPNQGFSESNSFDNRASENEAQTDSGCVDGVSTNFEEGNTCGCDQQPDPYCADGGTPGVWDYCDYGSDILLNNGLTGDPCSLSGGSLSTIGCDNVWVSCIEGRLAVYKFSQMECSDEGIPATDPSGPILTDCPSALVEGHTGQSCANAFTCARPAEDVCCIELAHCISSGNTGGFSLIRTVLCERGCENVQPNTAYPSAKSCAEIPEPTPVDGMLPPQIDVSYPCTGDFICSPYYSRIPGGYRFESLYDINGAGVALELRVPGPDTVIATTWCRNGIVMGMFF